MEHDINNLLNYIKLKKRPMQHDIKRKNKYRLYLSKKIMLLLPNILKIVRFLHILFI